jgi:hypothetical protein
VRLEFEIDKVVPAISGAKLKKLTTELDITNWELNRTHWAVKDVNLMQAMKTARILTDEKIRAFHPDSKFVRLGMTTPIAEFQVRPSVFRVPSGKVEKDLVSVMMPFETAFNKTFDSVKAASASCSLRCQRADDICVGRVEDWRADIRLRWLFHSFRRGPQSGYHGHVSSPRRIERSVRFSSHYAHLFASCPGL